MKMTRQEVGITRYLVFYFLLAIACLATPYVR